MAKKKQEATMNFWDKVHYIFRKPSLLFEVVKRERGIKDALLMYVIVAAFAASLVVLRTLFQMMVDGSPPDYGPTSALSITAFPFILGAVGTLFTFIYAGLMHIIVVMFHGKGTFAGTYKAYAYSMVPSLILTMIPYIGWLSVVYSVVLMVIGVARLQHLSTGKAALVSILPLFFILGALLGIVLTTIYAVSPLF